MLNYLNENDVDVPKIDAKDITPEQITERMQQLDASVPAPIYNEKTIPKKNYETLFAQDFSGTSGDLQTDNNAVTFLSTATQKEAEVDVEEAPIEEQEKKFGDYAKPFTENSMKILLQKSDSKKTILMCGNKNFEGFQTLILDSLI